MRLLAAGATAWLAVTGVKLERADVDKAIYILGLSTIYLVLFNPMTEQNSYVIVIPVMALVALLFLLSPQRRTLGWALALVAGTTGVLPEVVRKLAPNFGIWWLPLAASVFGAVFVTAYFREGFVALAASSGTHATPRLVHTEPSKS
jgi:hypothetical protein